MPPVGGPSTELESRVASAIRRERLMDSGDHVLVGVSGGADSMALLRLLVRLRRRLDLRLSVAHINHLSPEGVFL